MEDKQFSVTLKCLFCGEALEGDSKKEWVSGDMIPCQNCRELNDYDSLISAALDEGKELVAEYAKGEIQESFKNLFKKKT